jgi:anti-anti-sigma regulatory factor
VRLLQPQPEVQKTLENARLNIFFKIYHDLNEALQSF